MPTLPDVKAYDVLVVGMGPAGATAAYQLSRAGLSVLGLDKATHPRYKVCGGGLSARIDRILEDDYKSVVEHTIYGIQFSYRGADPLSLDCSSPIAYMVMRDRFDHFLVEKARRVGTEVQEDEPVTSCRQLPGGIEVTTDRGRYQAKVLIGADVALKTALAPDLGAVRADPGQLEQVIMNLIVNARDAMPRGGKLTIETANAELDQSYALEHRAVAPGPYVMLAVSDTGVGMDAATQARVFEPFFTTKEKGKGTGLGLATVYGIVKQSGGNIWLYSEPGRGTTFKIYLPRVDQAPEQLAAAPAVRETPRGTETVLLVEDDDAVRTLTRKMLAAHGYTVLAAGGGAEALELAAGHTGPIHLLVTDVVLPGMSGRDLAARFRSGRPGVKVLYTSGYTDEAIVHHGILDAGIAFLQKPFTSTTLAHKVRETLDSD